MTDTDIKLTFNPGVDLQATANPGIAHAVVHDEQKRFDLTWDRFSRLYRTAEAVKERIAEGTSILDVGGFDGALALFLPQYSLDIIDPVSTGGSGLNIDVDAYEVVVSIDALEHVAPDQRRKFMTELMRVTGKWCFINYPARRTAEAQKLVYSLTDNPLVKEHVVWQLPSSDEVTELLAKSGFDTEVLEHTSLSQWVSQYLLQTLAPESGAAVNSYLLKSHMEDQIGLALYDLVLGRRRKDS